VATLSGYEKKSCDSRQNRLVSVCNGFRYSLFRVLPQARIKRLEGVKVRELFDLFDAARARLVYPLRGVAFIQLVRFDVFQTGFLLNERLSKISEVLSISWGCGVRTVAVCDFSTSHCMYALLHGGGSTPSGRGAPWREWQKPRFRRWIPESRPLWRLRRRLRRLRIRGEVRKEGYRNFVCENCRDSEQCQ